MHYVRSNCGALCVYGAWSLHGHTGILILVHFRDEFVQPRVLHELQDHVPLIVGQVIDRLLGDLAAV